MSLVFGVLLSLLPASVVEPPLLVPASQAPPAVALPGPPPSLPPGWESVPPLAFDVVTTRIEANGAEHRTVQRVLRGRDRASLQTDGAGEEWLFERNPVDPRRVSGYQVDHQKRRILAYDERDLRARLQIEGWSDVLTLRVRPQALSRLQRTGEREHAAGAAFEKHVPREGEASDLVEVWWSDSLLLPLRFTFERGGVRTTTLLEAFTSGRDDTPLTARLGDPRSRFPTYEVLDVSDLGDHRH